MSIRLWHIFAVALALRLFYVLALPQQPVVSDAVDYDTIGWNIASGGGFSMVPGTPSAKRPPLYPAFLGGVYRIFGHSYTAVRICQSALGALVCLLVFWAGYETFGRKASLIAAGICAVHPVMVAYSGLVLSEGIFIPLMAGVMCLFMLWRRRRSVLLLAAFSAVTALAVLARPTLIFFPVLLFAAEAWNVRSVRAMLFPLAFFAALFCLALVPWTMRNYRAFGKAIPFARGHGPVFFYVLFSGGPSPKVLADLYGMTGGLDEEKSDAVMSAAVGEQLRSPKTCLANTFRSARFLPLFWITSHSSVFGVDQPNSSYRASKAWGALFFKFSMLALQLALLATCCCGIVRSFRSPGMLFFLAPLVYFSLHLNNVPRYHVPVLPYVFLFSAVCLTGAKAQKAETI